LPNPLLPLQGWVGLAELHCGLSLDVIDVSMALLLPSLPLLPLLPGELFGLPVWANEVVAKTLRVTLVINTNLPMLRSYDFGRETATPISQGVSLIVRSRHTSQMESFLAAALPLCHYSVLFRTKEQSKVPVSGH
jgi:hypothetical protein